MEFYRPVTSLWVWHIVWVPSHRIRLVFTLTLQNIVHSKGVIHGNLSSGNVLIDDVGRARLAGFSLSTIPGAFEDTEFENDVIGGALRFRAAELMPPLLEDPDDFKPRLTTGCDVYSLGNVILQVCRLIRSLIF